MGCVILHYMYIFQVIYNTFDVYHIYYDDLFSRSFVQKNTTLELYFFNSEIICTQMYFILNVY